MGLGVPHTRGIIRLWVIALRADYNAMTGEVGKTAISLSPIGLSRSAFSVSLLSGWLILETMHVIASPAYCLHQLMPHQSVFIDAALMCRACLHLSVILGWQSPLFSLISRLAYPGSFFPFVNPLVAVEGMNLNKIYH
jgi:hypothetical protein